MAPETSIFFSQEIADPRYESRTIINSKKKEAEYFFTDAEKIEAIRKMCEEWEERTKSGSDASGFVIYCLYLNKFNSCGEYNKPIAVWQITPGHPTTVWITAETKEDRQRFEDVFVQNIKKFL